MAGEDSRAGRAPESPPRDNPRVRSARARLTARLVAAAWLALPGALAAEDAALVREGRPAAAIRMEERGGKTFLSVKDAVAALDGTMTWDERTRSYEVKVKSHTAVFGADAPVAVVDSKVVPLAAPVRANAADAWAEPEFFVRVLGPLTGRALAWNAAARTLAAPRVEATEIAVEPSVADLGDLTKIVLRFSSSPSYAVETTPDQVILHFPGAHLTAPTPEKLLDSPRVARLLVRGGEVTVVFREKGLAANVYALGTPPRLVVDVTNPAAPRAGATPLPAAPAKAVKTIVIDPGHGGTEEGAKGPGGTLEKDATLALAKTVQETLARRGYRVVLTRTSDATVGLEDRAAAANGAKADVFLSLHANASRAASAHGTEVYYLSLDASDRAAAALAETENRAPPPGTGSAEKSAAVRDLDLILWDLAQNQHLGASARLAEIVQADFNRLLGIATRGVKQAPFRVLIGVNAPAVLVEVSFITNADEERRLSSDEFRRQVADTLAGSLEKYFRSADAAAPVPYAPKNGGRG